MTKAELIKALEQFEDDVPVYLQWTDTWNLHELTLVKKMVTLEDVPHKGKRFPVLLPNKLQ